MESLVLRGGLARPDALGVLHEVIFDTAYVQFDGLGVRGRNADADAPFGIDLRILFAGLNVGSRYEIFLYLSIGDCRGDAEQRQAENS